MKNFKAVASLRSVHLLPLLALTIVQLASADDGGAFFNTPTTSSTYARVQYANQANLTRRFGISRDPTIQYISFDELYNKYNKGGSKITRTEPTSERPVLDDKMDIAWQEAAPNLRNGWTVERLPPEHEAVSPSKTRAKAPASAFSKGIDQVYAYSNAYSGQFAKEAAPSTARPTPGEYAHAIEEPLQDHLGAGSDLKSNAVVMETSWTDMGQQEEEAHRTTAVVNERSEASSVKPKTLTAPPPRAKADGVQSAWRPFSGPTAPPTTAPPKPKRQKTVRPETVSEKMATNDSEDDVLFYGEAQKAVSRRPRPNPMPKPGGNGFPQQQFVVRPNDEGQLWLMPNVADNEVTKGGPPNTPRPFAGVQFAPPAFLQHSNQHPIVLPPNDHRSPPPFRHDRVQPQWSSVNPHFPLNRPSGPVGVAPQLLNPSGQVRPRPQEQERRPIHIPLPLPRPSGPLGSSPSNPLPGPPIPLPGIPAFNMHANDGSGRPHDRDRHQRFPPGPPQHFPTVHVPDRSDGPKGPPDNALNNFVRGPQQPPFNPNGQQPSFNPNGQQPSFNPNGQQPSFNPNGQQPFSPNGQQPPFNPNGQQPGFNPNGHPNGQRPNFNRPPPPPPTAPSSTSILKSLFSRFFPFARSMDLDGIPVVDFDQLTNNGTNLTALTDAPPEVVAHLLKLASNATSDEDLEASGGNSSNATEIAFENLPVPFL